MKGTLKTNLATNFLPSLMGTAIHSMIEEAIGSEDIFGDDFFKEIEVEYEGLKGHLDLAIKSKQQIVDWKTTTKKNMSVKSFPYPSKSYIYQVQVYAYLLMHDPRYKDDGWDIKTVTIIAIARDGGVQDITEYSYDYDEQIALDGIQWLSDIEEIVANGLEVPAPEKHAATFCSSYCSFYDPTGEIGCPGLPGFPRK